MSATGILAIALALGLVLSRKALGAWLFETDGRPYGFGTERTFRSVATVSGLVLFGAGVLDALGVVRGRPAGPLVLLLGLVFVAKSRSSAEQHYRTTGLGSVAGNQKVFLTMGLSTTLVGLAMLIGLL